MSKSAKFYDLNVGEPFYVEEDGRTNTFIKTGFKTAVNLGETVTVEFNQFDSITIDEFEDEDEKTSS